MKTNKPKRTNSTLTSSSVAQGKINKTDDRMRKCVCVSKASCDYACCLANPFSGPLAGVPSYPTMRTLKSRVWVKGTFSTSSMTGVGSIEIAPSCLAVNDIPSVWASDASCTLATFSATGAEPGINTSTSNAQYASTTLGNTGATTQYRIVSCGLRVRYMGTELDRGGYKIAICDPTHDNLSGRSIANINAEMESKKFPIDRKWVTVLYRPVTTFDLEFSGTLSNVSYMGVIVQAASAATPLAYEFEVFAVVEYQGRTVRGQTFTHSDPVGFSSVNTVATVTPALAPSSASDADRTKNMMNGVVDHISRGASTVTHVAQGASQAINMATSVAKTGASLWGELEALATAAEALFFLI